MDVVVHVDQTRSRNRGEINRITLNFRRYSALIKELTGKQFARRGNKRRNTKGYKGFAFWDDYFETWIALLKTRLISSFPESSRTRIRKPPFRLLFRTVKKKRFTFEEETFPLRGKFSYPMQNFLPKESKVFSRNDIFAASCQEFKKDKRRKKKKEGEKSKNATAKKFFFSGSEFFFSPPKKSPPR